MVKRGCGAHPIGSTRDPVPCQGGNGRRGDGDAPHAMVCKSTVSNIERAIGVPNGATGPIKLRRNAGAICKARNAATGKCGHGRGGEHDAANSVTVLLLHNVARGSVRVKGDASRTIKLRGDSNAIGAASGAAAGECGHRARGRNFSDAHVAKVCHVHVTKHINGNIGRAVESGGRAQAVKKSVAPAASKGAHRAGWSYAAHAVAQMLPHEHAKRNWVNRHAKRHIEQRRRALSVCPPRCPAPR